jgi:pimeloyl-ACP methyl ester carboxylesterase
MDASGIEPGDPLLVVGYSGGGVIAAKLAADPELNTVAAVNLGGPVASAPTREGVGVLSIEHEEDLVPGSGGSGHPSDERVEVSRSVLDDGRRYGSLLPAHELARYRETAALIDESAEERLAGFHALAAEFTRGASGTQSDWVARRDLSPSPTDER